MWIASGIDYADWYRSGTFELLMVNKSVYRFDLPVNVWDAQLLVDYFNFKCLASFTRSLRRWKSSSLPRFYLIYYYL